jgi:hypothetical protein
MTNQQLTELCRDHLDALAAVQRVSGPPPAGGEPAGGLAQQIADAALATHAGEYAAMRRAHVRLAGLTRPARPQEG